MLFRSIDNDLKYVDDKIRNYYEIGEFLSDDDLKAIDEAVKHEDITIKEEKPKRGRRSAKKEESEKTSEKEDTEKPEETTVGEPDNAEVPKSRVRTRKSREEVQQENAEKVANAGITEGDDREEVPFEETETPELEKVPRRTRRRR